MASSGSSSDSSSDSSQMDDPSLDPRLLARNQRDPETEAHLEAFQAAIKAWEEAKSQPPFDPTEHLLKMVTLFEKASASYFARDPDPFEVRHPSRVIPECALGQLLKIFFKKESLVQDLLNSYMRDNYWTRTGQAKDAFELNVAACRLIITITPGLELSVLSNTDGLISQLFRWVDKAAAEPLLSYATVVLASAMEITAVATEPDNREKSFKLVPTLVKRLRTLIQESQSAQESFKRPFVHLGNHLGAQPLGRGVKRKSTDTVECETEKSHPGSTSPSSHQNGDWSNSSWTEVESQILGQFSFHPLDSTGKMVAILRFLTPLAEYQEFLAHIHELNGVQDIFDWCLNMRDTKNARLAFEALKFLTALFCHKKFVTEWVNKDHIQQLLSIPRPSIASTAVSQCLFYLSCDDDSMEKVCLMPEHLQIRLVKYVLWLMECSHDTGRQFGVMFFGMSAAFRKLLELYDKEGGQRKVFNTISTLRVLNPDDDGMLMLTDDEEYTQRQKLRHAMVALKKYFEAHLALKWEQLKRSMGYDPAQSPQPAIVSYKPIRLTSDQVFERVSSLMNHMPFRSRWGPVDEFINLDGVSTCLQIIAMAYDWTFTGRSEMVRCALDVLAICCVVPKVQLQLCERIELYDETKTVGINIILGAAEGDIVQDSAEVRKSALTLIINCVCAPINRPGVQGRHAAINNSSVTTTPGSTRRKTTGKSSEDLITKVWDCCRSNNGIMALLELLSIKTPITDADAIRALACKALVGLARSDAAKQIMSKLPIFTNGQLQQLVREPILQDKRTEHYKFQQYAHELMEIVSTGEGQVHRLAQGNDFSVEMLHRASVVAQTKIRFSKKQLLQLIQEYLASEGLSDSASVLQREANIAVLNAPSNRSLMHRSVNNTPNSMVAPSTPHRPITSTSSLNRGMTSPIASTSVVNRSLSDGPGTPSSPPTSSLKALESSALSTPNIPIRINRNRGGRHDTPMGTPASSSKNIQRACEPFSLPNASEFNQGTSDKKVTLVSIVSDYLFSQHSLCKNPMTTCPEFDLLIPHKCPDPRPKNAAPMNFSLRNSRREVWPPCGGPEGAKLDRQLIYSRFKPSKSFKLEPRDENTSTTFSSCAFMPDDSFLLAGTSTGDVKMFNMATGSEDGSFSCHQTILFHLQPNREGKLLLTSSAWRIPYSGLWSLGEFFENKMNFNHDEYVEFSNVHQDKVIGTKGEKAKIYDINTQKVILELNPAISNNYSMNRATFDPFDDLILNDGVLFDSRSGKEIRKLDKLNQTLSGVFHPNGLEIISNTEVWDLRTFHLLKTVPGLDQCTVKFSNSGNIIYAVTMQEEEPDGEEKFESAFRTFDASDYSSIATIETRRAVVDLATSHFDLQLAVVENSNIPTHEESVVRLYDVGQIRSEEDEAEDDDNDGDEGEEDDSDDGEGGFNFFTDDDEDDYDDDEDDDDDDEDEEMIMLDEDDDGDGDEDNAGSEAGPRDPPIEEQEVANGEEGELENNGEVGSDDDGSWEDVDEEVSIG